MSDNRISHRDVRRVDVAKSAAGSPSVRARLTARVHTTRLDAMLAVGVPAPDGSALAVRAARLTSQAKRAAIARALRHAVRYASSQENRRPALPARASLHRNNIAAAADIIDTITLRLHAPIPVDARGMARLNRVLADNHGPLYGSGRGDLSGRLGAALAAL